MPAGSPPWRASTCAASHGCAALINNDACPCQTGPVASSNKETDQAKIYGALCLTICPFSHADIHCVPCGLFAAITDTSDAQTGTAGPPSGSIPPPSPEAAARVKTTSTAPGVYSDDFFFHAYSCVVSTTKHVGGLLLDARAGLKSRYRFDLIRIAKTA